MRRIGQLRCVIGHPIGIAVQTFQHGLADFLGIRDCLADLLAYLELNTRAGGQMRQVVFAADPSDELAAGQHDDAMIAAAARSSTDPLLDTLRQQGRYGGVGNDVHQEHVVVRRALRKIVHHEKPAGIARPINSIISVREDDRAVRCSRLHLCDALRHRLGGSPRSPRHPPRSSQRPLRA